jgi:hypothetical protein
LLFLFPLTKLIIDSEPIKWAVVIENKSQYNAQMRGLLAFIVIFMLMPMGHALMVVMNNLLGDHIAIGAVIVFLLGLGLLVITRFTASSSWQSLLGALAGVLLWTGGVEYGFLYGRSRTFN